MRVSAQRVARRYYDRVGGILQAPPAMQTAITEWLMALVASRRIAGITDTVQAIERDGLQKVEKLHDDVEALRKNPTSWDLYKEVYEGLWVFGHPGERASVRDYQKLTPEKKQALTERAEKLHAYVADRYPDTKAGYQKSIQKYHDEIAMMKQFVRPGVDGSQGEQWMKVFPVDLTGWRYGDAELRAKAEAVIKGQAQGMLQMLEGLGPSEMRDEMVALYRKRLETGQGDWDSIKVQAVVRPSHGFAGMWQPATRALVIVMPMGIRDEDYENMQETVRHELQHFAQSYLAFVIGKDPLDLKRNIPGMPGKSQQTPVFQQRMNPTHPSYKADDPEARALAQKLRQQGIDPRQVNYHNLDDVEFYTELADAVSFFNRLVKMTPKGGNMRAAIKSFVGATKNPYWDGGTPDELKDAGGSEFIRLFKAVPFFLSLKRHAPQKWKKAVAELTKVVL